jgi:leucyl aminopeptidase
MQFNASLLNGVRRGACAVLGVFDDGTIGGAHRGAKDESLVRDLHRNGDFAGRLGECLALPQAAGGRLLLVGLGARRSWARRSYRRALKEACLALARSGADHAAIYLTAADVPDVDAYYRARYAAEFVAAALYRIPDFKSGRKPKPSKLAEVTAVMAERNELSAAKRGLAHGAALGVGQRLSRDLANLPGNVCTPTYLGNAAKRLARSQRRIKVRVLGPAEIKRLKMGSFLSVTRGSDEPPRLVIAEYRGAPASRAPIVLIGKGITFDTGGISLKDPPGMDEMKFDMSGAATVLGTLAALAEASAPVNVTVIVPTCENMPSGRATKPGDIVTSMSGQTIEVLNTDAEGRLILCDAITYSRRFKPSVVVDVATLTGACVIALGSHVSGLMSNDDHLAGALLAAGERTGDPCWRLPLTEDYGDQLRSNFADLANIGGREAGAITAGAFLGKFADGLRWAHLDIAGTAYMTGAAKGSTGRPVSMLLDFCLNHGQ